MGPSEYSEAKRKLLEKFLRGEMRPAADTQPITPRTPGQAVPLSHAQEQVWLHAQMAPDLPLYNEAITLHYSGPLNVAALQRSVNEIVRRHEAWRTCFRVVDGRPVQEVIEQLSISIPLVDLSALPPEHRDATALEIATADARTPLDLGTAPLFRAKLVRIGEERFRLYLTLNHIIFDGVAIYRVFLPELTALYTAFADGKPSPLPELPIQHADYACWERTQITAESLAADIEEIRKRVPENLPEVYLPTDHHRPRMRSFRGSVYPFRLRRPLTEALREFCRKEGISIFHLLLGGFAALLQRYSGVERLPMGIVTAGRSRPETEGLLGYFLNTVLLPADISDEPTFTELVHRARVWSLEALEHDRVPFEYLVRELKNQREPDRNPLFQALFSLEPPMVPLDPAWRITQMDVDTGTSKYDLYLEMDERADEVLARFHYSTDLFERQTIAHMAMHWKRFLRAAISDPDRKVSQLPLMNSREQRSIIALSAGPEQDYPAQCVHQLFEQQVELHPDAIAVLSGSVQLTYRELNERANQLARYLIHQGVGPDSPVGLRIERRTEMVIALLGILKAGGAYVPLDLRLPEERLAFLLQDVSPSLLLSEKWLQTRDTQNGAVLMKTDWSVFEQQSRDNPNRQVSPNNLAYIMYTSGSTGAPKGVAIEHRSVVNLLCSMQREPGLSERDVLLAVTTLSFDIAALEIFLPLISGARVVIAGSEDVVDPERLKELIEESQATFVQATPTTWRMLVNAGWQGRPGLKIVSGGEPLPPELAQELILRADSVWNVYGPTETTIWSSIQAISQAEYGTIPIGRPVANTTIFIVDKHGNPVPRGITGEIYIGGDGLARGYLNRPKLTAERFVRNWLVPQQSARLYRTGDLGRFRSNGEIEYLGRVDSQIKLRGQRIELGEIESVLAGHSAVREAVVAVTGEGAEQKLSAYLVLQAGATSLGVGELRRYVRTKLPEHMVPATYCTIEKLPLLPSGKVNRAALAACGGVPLSDGEEWLAPRNETEVQLAGIWEELLKVQRVGVEQNFFELGGHSLLVLQMTARIRRLLEVDLPVRSVFENPTIAALAREVQQARALGLKARTPILQRRREERQEPGHEELLTQLHQLPMEEARNIVKAALDVKRSDTVRP
jgi:amino acid adenylation domain-containing protein